MRDGNMSGTGAETAEAPVTNIDMTTATVSGDAPVTDTTDTPLRESGRTRRLFQRLARDSATIEHRARTATKLAEIDEADHARRVANRARRSEARHASISAALPGMVYFLAIASGVAGQVTSIVTMSGGVTVAIVIAAVLAAAMIEGVGLAFAALAHTARVAGNPAYLLRVATWGFAFGASAINIIGHYGTIWAYPCGLGSVAALAVWEARSSHSSREALAATRQRAKKIAAARLIVNDSLRRCYGKKIANATAASLSPEELLKVSDAAISPQTSALDALTRYVDDARERRGVSFGRLFRRGRKAKATVAIDQTDTLAPDPATVAVDKVETPEPTPVAVDKVETPARPVGTGRMGGATVIPMSGATDDEIAAVEAAYPNWRTEMPSVRQIGPALGKGKSVGQRVRKRLAEILADETSEVAS